MRRSIAFVLVVVALTGCGWLFDQKPVCPASHPRCWENDPAIDNPQTNNASAGPEGLARDAAADTGK